MAEETVEQKMLLTIGAWVRRGTNVASDRWHEMYKKFGRNSPEERRASNYLHDLVNFCMNIRGWVKNPTLHADTEHSVQLRLLYGPEARLGDREVLDKIDGPREQRDLFRAMLVEMVEKGEGCILGEGRSLGPGCCRYCDAKELLKKYP